MAFEGELRADWTIFASVVRCELDAFLTDGLGEDKVRLSPELRRDSSFLDRELRDDTGNDNFSAEARDECKAFPVLDIDSPFKDSFEALREVWEGRLSFCIDVSS